MNREIASEVSQLMLNFSAKLNSSVEMVMEGCTKEEFEKYRDSVGQLMGTMLLDIMNPIYNEFPDLKPDGLD